MGKKLQLNETVQMMASTDYKDRFKAEYLQLKIRIEGLSNMLKKYKKGTLTFEPTCSYELLHTQLVYMECYLNTLEERAKIEGIELEM
ncbi:crAss001_48 related protein [Clostridium perfringens]|uniref:crAss001_48 related protein n=1 Tax=Clostridium perfringens TaxID=1502 RepID=UPI0039EAC359